MNICLNFFVIYLIIREKAGILPAFGVGSENRARFAAESSVSVLGGRK